MASGALFCFRRDILKQTPENFICAPDNFKIWFGEFSFNLEKLKQIGEIMQRGESEIKKERK